jgi:hypothetical protein
MVNAFTSKKSFSAIQIFRFLCFLFEFQGYLKKFPPELEGIGSLAVKCGPHPFNHPTYSDLNFNSCQVFLMEKFQHRRNIGIMGRESLLAAIIFYWSFAHAL